MEYSNDTIGNRTRDLLTCSAVPRPTAPPRSPKAEGPGENHVLVSLYLPQIPQWSGVVPDLSGDSPVVNQLTLAYVIFTDIKVNWRS